MSRRLPNLRSLQVLEAAARHASFKLAALELHVTPSAVSRQIRELEEVLGFDLFERRNRKVQITPKGSRYADALGRSFDIIATATAELTRSTQSASRLTLLVERQFALRWLLPNLHDFKQHYADIDIEIVPATEINELPVNGPKAAIIYRKATQKGVRCEHLLTLRAFPVCRPSPHDPSHSPNSPSDLGRYRLLHDRSTAQWRQWLTAAGAADVDWSRGHIMHEASLAIAAALAGEGVALGDNLLALPELESGRLVQPFELTVPTGSYYLATWMGASPGEPLRRFQQWLVRKCAEQQRRSNAWLRKPRDVKVAP